MNGNNLSLGMQKITILVRGLFKTNNSKVIIWEAVPFDSILDFDRYKVGEIIKVMDNNRSDDHGPRCAVRKR